MGWSFIASATGMSDASGTSLTLSSLNVAAGDLLVVWAAWEDGASTISAADGDNSITFLTTSNDGSNYGALGYKISAAADASCALVLTWGTARGYRYCAAMQFRPDGGETVTLAAGPSADSGSGSSMESGALSPSGGDLVVVSAAKNYGSSAFSNEQIAGGAAGGSVDVGGLSGMWYRFFSSNQTGITGTASGSSSSWIADIAAFESAAGVETYNVTDWSGVLIGESVVLYEPTLTAVQHLTHIDLSWTMPGD